MYKIKSLINRVIKDMDLQEKFAGSSVCFGLELNPLISISGQFIIERFKYFSISNGNGRIPWHGKYVAGLTAVGFILGIFFVFEKCIFIHSYKHKDTVLGDKELTRPKAD